MEEINKSTEITLFSNNTLRWVSDAKPPRGRVLKRYYNKKCRKMIIE